MPSGPSARRKATPTRTGSDFGARRRREAAGDASHGRACDGSLLLGALESSVMGLAASAEELNALNVFPVPDGDTGSNMLATMRAALEEAKLVPEEERTVGRIAGAISFGALMGARGNSGVILSQIIRGIAEELGDGGSFDGVALAAALRRGSEASHHAVARPVDGTILTVIRETAAGASQAAEHDPTFASVVAATVTAAGRSVANTPSLLPLLRDAGVVDAGGRGLEIVLQAALSHLAGVPLPLHAIPVAAPPLAPNPTAVPPRAGARDHRHPDGARADFGYETIFLLTARSTPLDVAAIRADLESIGDSVLVAGDTRAVKVHVHNDRPDQVVAYGLALGSLTRITIENLDEQVDDLREARARESISAPLGSDPLGSGSVPASPAPPAEPARSGPASSAPDIVVVTSGHGLERVFASFGVRHIVRGGQGDNPSTGELLRAIRATETDEVLLLPNNPNATLAAERAGELSREKRVVVVPTRNSAEGFAALLALDPHRDAAGNARRMTDAARAVRTLHVTEAIRDGRVGERWVAKGQVMALDPDEGLVAAGEDPVVASVEALSRLDPGFELVTLYYGEGVGEREAAQLADAIRTAIEGVDVEVIEGGQPHHRYVIAAE